MFIYFLDLSTLTCAANCPAATTRDSMNWILEGNSNLPSTSIGGTCSYDCAKNNMLTCPNLSTNIDFSNYYKTTSFDCNTGYTRVFYKCVQTSLVSKSNYNYYYFYNPHIIINY